MQCSLPCRVSWVFSMPSTYSACDMLLLHMQDDLGLAIQQAVIACLRAKLGLYSNISRQVVSGLMSAAHMPAAIASQL